MAQLEVIALDTATPQLRAPGGSDTYLMPKDLTVQSTVNATNVEVTNVKAKDGTAAITIADSTGNVGIGTASPGYKFDVVKGSVGDVARFTNGVDASLIVGAPTGGITYNQLNGGYQSWQIASSEKMRLDSSGNVGIGTASPSYRLQVSGTAVGSAIWANVTNTDSTTAGSTAGFFGNNGAVNTVLYAAGQALVGVTGTTTNHPFLLFTNGSERMRIDSSGNVGIGTTSPGVRADISGVMRSATWSLSGTGITGGTTAFSAGTVSTDANWGMYFRAPTGSSAIAEYSFRNAADTERMRIDSSGNVGIGGTASALAKLHLLGTYPTSGNSTVVTRVTGTIPSGSTSSAIIFQSNPTTEAASFTLSSLSHFYAAQQTLGAGSTVTNQYGFNALSTLTGATNNYGFYSNIASGSNRWNLYCAGSASNYMAGSLGVAATPSANASLLVGQGGSDYTLGTNYAIFISGNGYSGGIALDGTSMQIGQNGSARSLTFHSGTSFAERMRITAGGEVYIAGTTDQGAYNLQCNGTGVWGAGAYVNGSDERLKDDIATLNDGLNVVSQLRPVTFKYKPDYSKDQNVQTGFIAQELQAVLAGKDYVDGIVQSGPKHLNVAYQSLIPILVKAIQELTARVAELEAK